MRRFFLLVAVSIQVILVSRGLSAPEINPLDFVLHSYQLTAEQSGQYKSGDGKAAEFWTTIKDSGQCDFVHLIPSIHGFKALAPYIDSSRVLFASGLKDAQVWAYSAWSDKGIYLLYEVLDDQFIDQPSRIYSMAIAPEMYVMQPPYWLFDCIDFFFDIYPSSDIVNHPVHCVLNQITNTTIQFQYQCGSKAVPTTMEVNKTPPGGIDRWDPVCNPNGLHAYELLLTPMPVLDVTKDFGIETEIVKFDENRRAQEWFIPWNSVGTGGMAKPSIGQKIAFSVQYNDNELDMDLYQLLPDFLLWVNKGNPLWKRPSQNWGDICFVAWPETPTTTVRNQQKSISAINVSHHEGSAYSIDGKSLSARTSIKKSCSVVIEKFQEGPTRLHSSVVK